MQQIGFFIAKRIVRSTCFGHHNDHHQELKELYRRLLPAVLGALVYRSLVWCGAVGCLSSGHITHSSTPDQQPVNQSAKYRRQQLSV